MKLKIVSVFLVFLFLTFIGCTQTQVSSDLVKVNISIIDDTNTIIFSGEKDVNKGLNAFDALKQVVGENNFSYKSYDFGIFIESFMNKTAPKTHFWALYVNGKKAETGITSYSVDFDTNYFWVLEKIESS